MECVRSYAWSKGHSDPDLSSVNRMSVFKKINYRRIWLIAFWSIVDASRDQIRGNRFRLRHDQVMMVSVQLAWKNSLAWHIH